MFEHFAREPHVVSLRLKDSEAVIVVQREARERVTGADRRERNMKMGRFVTREHTKYLDSGVILPMSSGRQRKRHHVFNQFWSWPVVLPVLSCSFFASA